MVQLGKFLRVKLRLLGEEQESFYMPFGLKDFFSLTCICSYMFLNVSGLSGTHFPVPFINIVKGDCRLSIVYSG